MRICPNPDSYLKTCVSPFFYKTPQFFPLEGTIFRALACCGLCAWQSNKSSVFPLSPKLSLHVSLRHPWTEAELQQQYYMQAGERA